MKNIVVKEITSKEIWDKFVISQPFYTFLQSWAWGEFNKLEGNKVYRLGFYDGKNVIGVSLLIVISARRGKFLFCPHGPLIDWENKRLAEKFFDTIRDLGQKENCWFIRISPSTIHNSLITNRFKNYGFIDSPLHMHAENSWILDITPGEEQLLAEMRKTTRYLVRQGENLGIKVSVNKNKAAMEKFIKVHLQHAKDHHYVPFSAGYLMNEWQVFSPDNIAIFQATHQKKILAQAVIIFYGKWAFYYQAITEHAKIPIGYVLVWEAIKEAKKRGCTGFNFWGIAPEGKSNHPWAGLTLFKQGFGGERLDLMHAQDLPLSPFYWLTYLFETLRRVKRGF